MSLFGLLRADLMRRPGRTLLTLFGIAIGVGGIVAIRVAIADTQRAHAEVFNSLGGRADLEVVALDERGVAESALMKIRAREDVLAAVGVVQGLSGIRLGENDTLPLHVIGVDFAVDDALRPLRFTTGEAPRADDEILLEHQLAGRFGIAVGGRTNLISPTGLVGVRVVGLIEGDGVAQVAGGLALLTSHSLARRLIGLGEGFTAVQIVLRDGARAADVRADLDAEMAPALTARTPSARASLAAPALASTTGGLDALSVISLIACAFVVANAMSMSVGERRRRFAVLRAVGLSRRALERHVLLEAAVIGILGSLVGLFVGVAGARVLAAAMELLILVPMPSADVSVADLALGFGVGVTFSTLAALVPARAAGRIDVTTELADRRVREGLGPPPRQAWLGLGLLVVSFSVAPIYIYTDWLPMAVLMPGMGAFVVGAVLALRLLTGPLLTLVERIFPFARTLYGRLALAQMRGRMARTSLTMGVLFVAVSIALGSGGALHSSVREIDAWSQAALRDDFYLRATFPDSGLLMAAGMNEDLTQRVLRIPGVTSAACINFQPTRIGGLPAIAIAVDGDEATPIPLHLAQGDEHDVQRRLEGGDVALGVVLARAIGAKLDDEVALRTRHGEHRLRVCALVSEYTAGGHAFYMDRERAREIYGFSTTHVIGVRVRPDDRESVAAELANVARDEGLMFQTLANVHRQIEVMLDGIVSFLWLLIALVYVVAALGIVNTLTMNVLEQTREIALMRSVGLSRRGAARCVRMQALIAAAATLIVGVPFGLVLGWLQTMVAQPTPDHLLPYRLSPTLIVLATGGAVLASYLAALAPARRAASLSLDAALLYE